MPAEHRAEAVEAMRLRALELLEPLRAEIGPKTSEAIVHEFTATIEEIDQSA